MLSASQRRELRAKSHSLKPVVMLGQHGLGVSVIAAIDEALTAHELVKVRLRGVERADRSTLSTQIAEGARADIVNSIGLILILYRANPTPAPAPVKTPPIRKRRR
ncbi:MAG: YhbY family RNA-binding protein [Gammaproteobacteria bacterium]|nr:YhbY family RNA-binding protein [Gammaproteobacteria bacterium]